MSCKLATGHCCDCAVCIALAVNGIAATLRLIVPPMRAEVVAEAMTEASRGDEAAK